MASVAARIHEGLCRPRKSGSTRRDWFAKFTCRECLRPQARFWGYANADRNKREIDRLSIRRSEVMRELSRGHDARLAAEHQGPRRADCRTVGRAAPGPRTRSLRRPQRDHPAGPAGRAAFPRGLVAPPTNGIEAGVPAVRHRGNCLAVRRPAIHCAARGVSSAGRASALQAEGHRFDPDTLHHRRNGRFWRGFYPPEPLPSRLSASRSRADVSAVSADSPIRRKQPCTRLVALRAPVAPGVVRRPGRQ